MAHFVCDNKRTEDLLRRLLSIVKGEGAYVHENVGFFSKDGHFSAINSEKIRSGQKVIVMPESATVRAQEFRLDFKNNEISVLSHSDKVSAREIEIMEIVVEIYNANRKLLRHRDSSVLTLFYQDPALFKALTEHCKWNVFKDIDQKSEADCIGRNFIGLRMMEKSRAGKNPAGSRLLLPFIEYFNHHPMAPSVGEYAEEDGAASGFEVQANFSKETDDLFISYGPYDCFDLLVLQGYVDSGTFFVRSRPMVIHVPGLCRLQIDMQLTKPVYKDLPEELEGIAFYLPRIQISEDRKTVYLSHLMIPSRVAPQAMRRLLKFVFLLIAQTNDQALEAVLYTEEQILENNLSFYLGLLGVLQSCVSSLSAKAVVENIGRMAEVQIQKIKDYKSFLRL